MDSTADSMTTRESAFATRQGGVADLPTNTTMSEGSESQERDIYKGTKAGFRRNPTYQSRQPQNPHRRYKSLPGGGYSPTAPAPLQPGSARAAGAPDNTFTQPVPMYHPWASGYDVQWSAYGMYVHSTIMSLRSDKPTRVVFIGNLSPSVKEKHVIEAASKFGTLRGVDDSLREYWFGMYVCYWDLRHAEEAARGLMEVLPGVGSDDVQRHPCNTFFMMPRSVPGMENQGMLTIKIRENVTSTMIRTLCSNFGDVRTVRSAGNDAKAVEFFDARNAQAALAEIKASPEHQSMVKDVEITSSNPISTTEPQQQQPQQQQMNTVAPRPEESGSSDGEAAASQSPQWTMTSSSPYGSVWNQYPPPPMTQQPYVGEMPRGQLRRQHSAPPNYIVNASEAMWSSQYMGYPTQCVQPWPYAGGHHSTGVPMVPVTSHFESGGHLHRINSHPNTTGYDAHATVEGYGWRPHRTRSGGDRSYDPSHFQFNLEEASGSDPAAARTTLMIRNIPNKYSQKMLLDVLNKKYSRRFDFFYLPIDFKNRCNLGYAFVNFIDIETTVEFYKEFHTKSWEEFNSKKVCEITYARVQGKKSLIEHFRNSRFPCNDPDYLPLVFETEDDGQMPASKGTPVHHWGSPNYPENNSAAVAAH